MGGLVAYFATIIGLIGCLVVAAVGDIRHFRIPNKLVLAVLLLYPLHAAFAYGAGLGPALWWDPLAAFAITFFVGLAAFQFNLMGGGDVKLFMALAPWAGLEFMPALVLVTAIAGGGVATVMLVKNRLSAAPGDASPSDQSALQAPVPYGVAIAFGGIYVASELILNGLRG